MPPQQHGKKEAHKDAVWSLCFLGDDHVASGSVDGTIKLWRLDTGSMPPQLKGPEKTMEGFPLGVLSLVALSEPLTVAASSMEGSISIVNLGQGTLERTIKAGPVDCWTLAVSGDELASGTHAGAVNVWNWRSGALVRTLEGSGSFGLSVAWHGPHLAVGCKDGSIRLYDMRQPDVAPKLLTGHALPVRSLAFSSNSVLYSGCDDASALCFSAVGGEKLGALAGNLSWIFAVAASDKWVSTAGADKKVRVFDAATREAVAVFEGHTAHALAVSFSRDGKFLVSGGGAGDVLLYSL